MKPVKIYILSLFLFTTTFAAKPESFYYYKSEKIPLEFRGDQLHIHAPEGVSEDLYSRIKGIPGVQIRDIVSWEPPAKFIIQLDQYLHAYEIQEKISALRRLNGITLVTPVFRRGRVRHLIGADFVVKFGSSASGKNITDFDRNNGFIRVKKLSKATYLYKTDGSVLENGLTAANYYFESGMSEWAQPRFYYPNWEIMNATVNDPYWPEQWAHVNTGQPVVSNAGEGFPERINGYADADMDVDLAWDLLLDNGVGFGGSPDIIIAILDSGVDIEHPDLNASLLNEGVDFSPDSFDNAQDVQGHGTAVTGIIGAVANNGIGVSGIAPGCKILPVKWYTLYGGADNVGIAQAIDYAWQNGADVLNNSWGGTTPDQVVEDALNRAKTQGRDGLGCVIVFSSGNEGNGEVNYPANLEDVIAVGASNMFDEKKNPGSQDLIRKWGGNYGTALDLVAPTTVYTTDIMEDGGFSEEDYSPHFGGTSAACPHVSAAAALVLSADNGLSSDQVQDILQKSADPVERYAYDQRGWNKHVGFGRVNAYNAVRLAVGRDGEMPVISHAQQQSTQTIDSILISAEISDNEGLSEEAVLWYRTVFEGDTSQWNMLNDDQGPSGNLYEFILPGQKWRTQVQYYFAATDLSSQNNTVTFPFGGGQQVLTGDVPPPYFLNFHVGEFISSTYASTDVPVSIPRSNTFYTSTLSIEDAYLIIDINATISVDGNIQDFAITLEAPDSTASGIAMLNGDVGEEYRYLDTELDDEAITELIDGLPPYTGSFIPDNTLRVFDGAPSKGDWVLRVYDDIYYNNGGSIDAWSIETTYMQENYAPVVSDIPAQSIQEGGSFESIDLPAYVTDQNHSTDEIDWRYSGNTDLIVQINSENQAEISTPDEDWYGEEIVTFTAVDPGGWTDEDTVRFSVSNINDYPVLQAIPVQETDEDQPFDPIRLDDYVNDVDDPDSLLTWNYQEADEVNITIDSNRVALVEARNANWYGSDTVLFICTDPGGLNDSAFVSFLVQAVNDTPSVSAIADQSIEEGEQFDPLVLDDYVNDVDDPDSVLQWKASGMSELSVEIDDDRIAHITLPNEDWSGSEWIVFTVRDTAGLPDSTDVNFSVAAVNDTPVVSAIPSQSVAEGDTFAAIILDDFVEDVDNEDLEMNWKSSETVNLAIVIDENRHAWISVFDPEWNGSETVRFICTDPGGLKDSSQTDFTVTYINDPPMVGGIEDQAILTGESFTEIILDEYAEDPDHNTSELDWSYSGNNELSVIINENRIAEVIPPDDEWVGSERIVFIATDPGGLSGMDSASFSVKTEFNSDPVALEDYAEVIEDGESIIDVLKNDSDPDDDDLIILDAGSPVHGISALLGDSLIRYVPSPEYFGPDSFIYIISDQFGGSDQGRVTLEISPVNDPPVFSLSDTVTLQEDDSLYYPFSTLYPFVHDPDDADSALTFQIQPKPDKIITEPFVDGYMIKGVSDWAGEDSLLCIASDLMSLSDSSWLTVRVSPVNDAPVVFGIPDSLRLHPDSIITLILSDYRYDVDSADSLLKWTFSVSDSVLNYEFNPADETVKLFSSGIPGNYVFYLLLEDNVGAFDTDSISVRVDEATGLTESYAGKLPAHFHLYQNYPNPFNPTTKIRYTVGIGSRRAKNPSPPRVNLSIYNLLGQKVATLIDEKQPAGIYQVKWNAADLPSGIYFIKLQSGSGFLQTRKLIFIQ